MSRVEVREYTCQWPLVFEYLRVRLQEAIADIALAIEHVGSTSVPGLAAKPVVDLDVVVDEGDVATAIERLARLGYEHQGDLGIPGREAFRQPGGIPRHHLYVCVSGCPALANHLAVRDFLRADPEAAAEYGALKKRLAREFPEDIDSYIEGKTDFLLGILRRSGFPEQMLLDIELRNRASV